MTVKRLASGYWYARWSHQEWAQWREGRYPQREDFFHPEWSYSDARATEAYKAAASAAAEES